MEGQGRWARYACRGLRRRQVRLREEEKPRAESEALLPLSKPGGEIQAYLRKPPEARKPVGYNRAFLDSYRPNVTFYLSSGRARRICAKSARPRSRAQPAGTYAKQILNRLLIDLSWNSSRLEGNTYSLLDTKRLIDLGEEAEGQRAA